MAEYQTKVRLTAKHRQKYAGFLEMLQSLKDTNADFCIITQPWVLGDNYDEIITNLNLLAERKVKLMITAPDDPAKEPPKPVGKPYDLLKQPKQGW